VGSESPGTGPIEIVVTPAHKQDWVNVQAVRNGAVLKVITAHPGHAEKIHQFAEKVGIDYDTVKRAIDNLLVPEPSNPPAGPNAPVAAPPSYQVVLRGQTQPRAQGRLVTGATLLDALQGALGVLDYPQAEPVIEWDDTTTLAALDVDFHDSPLEQRPSPRRLEALATLVRPGPALWWVTHGRGLRLVYKALAGLTAAELAACAGLSVRSLEPSATFEVLSHTRHPLYPRGDRPAAGPVQLGAPTADLGELARWLGRDADDHLVQEWLAGRGLQPGRRYDHSCCPADPGVESHGEPVFVGDEGIFCHKCGANGLTLGGHKAGFFPWPALVGGGHSTKLRSAARHFCHWEHAQHILADDVGLVGEQARLCYSALLKAAHGADDPRVAEAMRRGAGLVRMDGYWATSDLSRPHARDGLAERLGVLPAVKDLVPPSGQDKGPRAVTNVERLAILRGVDDLAPYGYPCVEPVRGLQISGHWRDNTDPTVVRAVVLPSYLRPERMTPFRPRYIPKNKRMGRAEAEAVLGASFPGIDHQYLRLLVAARGCAEGQVGQPPRVAVDGPSGAGKDATVAVAAALIGDGHQDVAWVPNVQEFHLALYRAGLSNGLVTSSEVIKLVKAKRGDLLAGLSALLTFQRGLSVRDLYVGWMRVRQVPAVVVTDTSFPRELHCDEQVGRRFVYVHLERKVDWQRSARLGIETWRTQRQEHAHAANAIVSALIDEFFAGETALVFEDIARELGFPLLNHGGDMGLDPQADLLALFEACCNPAAVEAPSSRWKGRGWRLVKRESKDPLSVAWQAVCDNLGDGFTASRRVKEADWAKVLGVPEVVECDLSPNGGSTLAVRFRCGDPRSPSLKVNEEIRRPNPPTELPPPTSPPDAPLGGPPAGPPAPPPSAPPPPAPVAVTPYKDRAGGAMPPVDGPVFLDLETRSACHLKAEGGRRYADHPTTRILTAAALLDDRAVVWTPTLERPLPADALWPDGFGPAWPVETHAGPDLPGPLADAVAAGRPLCAHNALGFDAHVWREAGLPEPPAWLDTLPEARAAGLPGGLDALGRRLFGRGKDPGHKELLRKYCRPNRRGEFRPLDREAATRIARYNLADVLLLSRLYKVVRGHAEPEVLALDGVINGRGIAFDTDLAGSLMRLGALEAQAVGEEVERLTNDAIKAGDLNNVKRLRGWLKDQGLDLPDLKKVTVKQALQARDRLKPEVTHVLEARLAVARVTAGKLQRAVAARDDDGRVRDLLVYHKAHTGRWAGRDVQPHNLPRPHDDLRDLDALLGATGNLQAFRGALPSGVTVADGLSALVRLCFRAGPGRRLLVADYASIEARGVAWCAGERGLLDLFAEGGDSYCDLATRIFGRLIARKDKRERNVGKQAVLGCCYGMGAAKFAARCAAFGVDLAAAEVTAEQVVEGYRDAYPAIAGTRVWHSTFSRREGGLWHHVEAAALAAVGRNEVRCAGRCEFLRRDDALVVRLPSGRRLFYRNARVEDRVPGYCDSLGLPPTTKPTLVYDGPKRREETTYGAKLLENVVQAICRDLLVAALHECERQGLAVVLHVHDEIVVEVPEEQAEEGLRRLVVIASTPPPWAEGFPVEVEGFSSEQYLKSAPKGVATRKARNGQNL
jgi:DNA polymerase